MIVQFHYSQQAQEDKENDKVPDQLSRYSICHNLLLKTSLSSFSDKQERELLVFFAMLPQSKKYQTPYIPAFHKERGYVSMLFIPVPPLYSLCSGCQE